jgi:hypothetical protein
MARDGGRPPSLARRIPGRLASIVALSVIAAAVCVAPIRAQSLQSKPAPPTPPPDQPVVVRVEGGLVLCCATKGFIVGGAVAAKPHALDGVEVGGDVTVGRFGGFSILSFAADARYGVHIGRIKPYGGGGVGIVKTTGGGPTNVGAQVVAGVQLPSWGRHAVRVEARFLFLPAETTFIIGSISF